MQLAEIGRRQQLTDRPPAPRPARTPFIPNGPFSSPPTNPQDVGARRPAEAQLPHDRSATWLRNAAIGLCALAAATVSFTAQYRMVYANRQLAVVAGLEAAIPDAAALVFACLGIALALHGRRALRASAERRLRRRQRVDERHCRGGAVRMVPVVGAVPGPEQHRYCLAGRQVDRAFPGQPDERGSGPVEQGTRLVRTECLMRANEVVIAGGCVRHQVIFPRSRCGLTRDAAISTTFR